MALVWHGTADVTTWQKRLYDTAYVTDGWMIKVSLRYRLEDTTDSGNLQCALCCVHDPARYSKPYRLAAVTDQQTTQKPRAESIASQQHTEAEPTLWFRVCRNIE